MYVCMLYRVSKDKQLCCIYTIGLLVHVCYRFGVCYRIGGDCDLDLIIVSYLICGLS
jgi:hypothetical protein